MIEKRFSILSSYLGLYSVFDDEDLKPLSSNEVIDLMNKFNKENEQLKCGNKNLKTILNDFINICNRLQANPTDKQILNVARDMLQNMGVELE